MATFNGPVCSTDDDFGDATSSSTPWLVSTKGDTMRICTSRVIATATSTGVQGEFCMGTDSGTTYVYYCVATNTWVRAALATW
jgi:hypothetical protein